MGRFPTAFLALLLLAVPPLCAADCPEVMKLDSKKECTLLIADLGTTSHPGQPLRFRDLWQLDLGGVHPPLRLPYRRIQQLEMESIWGLSEGESIIGDPRWGYSELQPDLQAIARLLAREAAMAKYGETIMTQSQGWPP